MQNLINNDKPEWIRPWMTEQFDDLYNRDERYFAILIKGCLGWLTSNIILYNKPIKHFILNTGSSYLYVEQNGYEFSWNTTTGEDMIYMSMPRCVVTMGDISVPLEELTNPFIRGVYERKEKNEMKGFNAEIRRLPIELDLNLNYVLSNTNESLILAQELIDKLMFQRFFKIIYLGQIIECSIEFPQNVHIEFNHIDMSGLDVNQKTISISIKLCSNYPIINERSEQDNSILINNVNMNLTPFIDSIENEYKKDKQEKIIQ